MAVISNGQTYRRKDGQTKTDGGQTAALGRDIGFISLYSVQKNLRHI